MIVRATKNFIKASGNTNQGSRATLALHAQLVEQKQKSRAISAALSKTPISRDQSREMGVLPSSWSYK
jgi:hypothetical protein